MSNFWKDTFRPYTEEEAQGIRRHHRQKAVAGLLGMALSLVLLGIFALSNLAAQRPYQGTWIAYDDHADGFHPEDRWLELREGEFYLNGSHYGKLTRKDGKDIIPVHAPAGQYNRYLSVNGDVLTIEYQPPRTGLVNSSAYTSPYAFTDPASTAAIQSILSQMQEDRRVVDMYVRISEESNLTKEQRSQLY